MCKDGRFVEIQSTAEGKPFSRQDFDQLSDLAFLGITQLLALWDEAY
jgi:ribonuclease PH